MSNTTKTSTCIHPIFADCCGLNAPVRHELRKSWVADGFRYATNGAILVREECDENNSAIGDFTFPNTRPLFLPSDKYESSPVAIEELEIPQEKCSECKGEGVYPGGPCEECDGTGYDECPTCEHETGCRECDGGGTREEENPCESCNGDGLVDQEGVLGSKAMRISGHYCRLLKKHGAAIYRLAKIKHGEAPAFRFTLEGGIHGLIMPKAWAPKEDG